MKKVLSLLLVLLTLTACSSKAAVKPKIYGIEFTADITYYNENYKGECKISEDGVLYLKISEPELLSGYTVTVGKDDIKAEYLGIEFKPNLANMPFSSVIQDLYKVIGEIAKCESAEKKGDTYIIKGGKDADSYTLYISPTGLPQSLEMPDERFRVYFYNTKVLTNE